MSPITRRQLLGAAAAGAAVAAVPAVLRSGQAQAATTGTITDVGHVVILMQENRSFDHYYGTMRGVRGFGDRSTILTSGGQSVFTRPTA